MIGRAFLLAMLLAVVLIAPDSHASPVPCEVSGRNAIHARAAALVSPESALEVSDEDGWPDAGFPLLARPASVGAPTLRVWLRAPLARRPRAMERDQRLAIRRVRPRIISDPDADSSRS